MGWYHARLILEGSIANVATELCGIVEPFFSKNPHAEWQAFVSQHQLNVWADVADIPPEKIGLDLFAIIAVRTVDVPGVFYKLLEKGIKFIYLEKPGASSLEELRNMKAAADEQDCQVVIGYARNAHGFVTKPMASLALSQKQNETVNLTHKNSFAFTAEALEECFKRNSEGMLLNMACHDVAIAVKHLGLRLTHCDHAKVDPAGSLMAEHAGLKDFVRLKFSVAIDGCNLSHSPEEAVSTDLGSMPEVSQRTCPNGGLAGKGISSYLTITEDRCGGTYDTAEVQVGDQAASRLPSVGLEEYEKLCAAEPETAKYFVMQKDCYIAYMGAFVRERILRSISLSRDGAIDPLVDLGEGIEVLAICDMLTRKFKEEFAQTGTAQSVPGQSRRRSRSRSRSAVV